MSQQDKFLMKNPQNDDMSIREVTLYYQKMDWGPYFIIQEMIKTYMRNMDSLKKKEQKRTKLYIRELKKTMQKILDIDMEYDD